MDNNEILITGNTAKWVLPLSQGEVLGSYSGAFEFKCYLTPTQMLEAGREYRSLLGNLPEYASEKEKNISFALVELKYRIIKSPPFWTATLQDSGYAGNIPDLNIIVMVLEKAMIAESMFQERLQKEKESLLDSTIRSAEALADKKNRGEE
jgi:hypothetical protein